MQLNKCTWTINSKSSNVFNQNNKKERKPLRARQCKIMWKYAMPYKINDNPYKIILKTSS
jgi:hypothetical protein